MRISDSWLRTFIKTDKTSSEIADALTAVGLEVESIEKQESIAGGLAGLIIGQVVECQPHPNADRLKLTKVNIGQADLLQIVCGAPNVAAGQKVVVAPVGTTVFPTKSEPFKINKSKIRSELSEGMICADDEIGLGESHDGIKILAEDAPVGTLLKDYLGISSELVYEIGLTPNRADAASHLGVARDLAALYQQPIQLPYQNAKPIIGSGVLKLTVQNEVDCPRFSMALIKNFKVEPSPEWLQKKLKSIGVKSINNVVDITNYVCHGLGQPMHAYDAKVLAENHLIVRRANQNESLICLDGVERKLQNSELLVCDQQKVLGIAGVMGGLASSVKPESSDIILESAYFDAVAVRKTAKAHGLKTDASFRFERGTDPDICSDALQYAIALMQEICPDMQVVDVNDHYPKKIARPEIDFYFDFARAVIGKEISDQEMSSILKYLGIEILAQLQGGIKVSVPLAKVDVTRPIDLVEEILRIHGLNNIEMPKHLRSSLSHIAKPNIEAAKELSFEFMAANGFTEIMCNSLCPERYNELLSDKVSVKILNPLSQDLNVLRNQMIGSMLETISYNINRKSENLNLFEFGKCYQLNEGNSEESEHLCVAVSGNQLPEHWNRKVMKHDLFSLKKIVEHLLLRLGFKNLKTEAFVGLAGQGYRIMHGKQEIAQVIMVAKKILKEFDIQQEVFLADFIWTDLEKQLKQLKKNYQEPPKYPGVRRDLSMLIQKDVKFEQLRKIAMQAEQRLLKEVNIFDVYEGDKLPDGKKSYALSFVLQDEERTLQEQQIEQVMQKIAVAMEKEAGAEIRKAN